jgi:hypothetical protein
MHNFRMAPALGKRKRQGTKASGNTRAASEEPSESQDEDIQDVFRRHFEAHFKPLPTVKKAVNIVERVPAEGDGEESEWEGISEPEGILQDQIAEVEADFSQMAAKSKSSSTQR